MANHSLKGKVVVVGGGAKNMGGLISLTFGADGANVVVHYNSDVTKALVDHGTDDLRQRWLHDEIAPFPLRQP
jgi:NAD(P)-dependent dehydrogenase (short-subunit alcohol dehydrogenase family)